MMISKKKNNSSKLAEPKSFATNWEVQAEQLKYSVKKEVEEGNLIQEALKSLQRSFSYEEEKRIRAEQQKQELLQQIEELERRAKELKEQLNLTKDPFGQSENDDSESDSEEELTTAGFKEEEEFEFEQLLSEIRDDDSTESVESQMTIQQRLKLIRGFDTGIDGERHPKKTIENYKEHHKKIMKLWMQRELELRPMFGYGLNVSECSCITIIYLFLFILFLFFSLDFLQMKLLYEMIIWNLLLQQKDIYLNLCIQ